MSDSSIDISEFSSSNDENETGDLEIIPETEFKELDNEDKSIELNFETPDYIELYRT